MKNTHCEKCQNRTKLFIKLPGKNNYTYICKMASECPFTQHTAGEEIRLEAKA